MGPYQFWDNSSITKIILMINQNEKNRNQEFIEINE